MKNTFVLLLTLACSVAVGQTQKPFGDRVPKKTPSVLPSVLRDAELIDGNKSTQKIDRAIDLNPQLLKANIVRDNDGNVIWVDFKQAFKLLNNGRASMAAAALNYMKTLKSILKLNDPNQELEVGTIEEDDLKQTHIRLQQTYKNLPVYGGEMTVHAQESAFTSLNGILFKTPDLEDITPKLTESQAAQTALQDLKQHTTVRELKPNELQVLKKQVSETELLIYYPKSDPKNAHLTWRMVVRPNFIERWNYFIDAKTGQILLRQNHTCKLDGPAKANSRDLNGITQTVNTYLKGNTYYMIDASRPMYNSVQSSIPDRPSGAIMTLDAGGSKSDDISLSYITSSTNSWSPTAVSAHTNAGLAYNYFFSVHKRNGLDNKNGTMLSVINVKGDDGKEMDNAFWNGEFMAYGNGAQDFTPLAGGFDVAGHEMTHGVIENTARLEYESQSGALNESMADVFAVLMDRTNWTIGEAVVKRATFPSGALRSMSNPNQGGTNDNGYQPKTMAQYVNTKQDDGGVHINSGIPNYAFYLFATNASVGREKAEKVYYRVLTTYLTRYSQFKDLRIAVIKATTDLYGANSAEVKAAQSAFDQVGLTDAMTQNPTPAQTTLPTNSGTEFLLVYGSDDKLYSTSTTGMNITVKSSRAIVNRPSVTDDGKLVYVVNTDKRIRAISLVGNADETIVSNETVWNKVAISKDGKKMAALTEQADRTIYVYSFELQTWKKFLLSNPSYSSGVSTSDVQYADGLEWDASGEYLVYDAFNKIKSVGNNKSLDYWDLGVIRVWDVVGNTFGDGKIQKIIADLSDGESIGNPAFAKNSTAILTFDYLLEDNDTYGVFGIDLEKNTIKAIVKNNTLAYPDYSRLDDKIVYVSQGTNGKNNVSVIGLNADKISPRGTSSELLTNGKWPLWVSQGIRTLPAINFQAIGNKFENAAPFTLSATASTSEAVLFRVISGPATVLGNILTVTGVGTVVVRAYTQPGRVFYPIAVATQTFRVDAILSTNTLSDEAAQVFPNPVQNILTVRTANSATIEQIEILDITGRMIMSKQNRSKSSEMQIDTKQMATGQYQIGIQTSSGTMWKKVVKE